MPQVTTPPDFLVAPDLVAQGSASLAFSLSWLPKIQHLGRVYLVTQDGQSYAEVATHLPLFDGIFVGGTIPWKIQTGAAWVHLAHSHAKPCHIGRAGSVPRVLWAKRIGADSIDSCVPLWSQENLQRFVKALGDQQQAEFF